MNTKARDAAAFKPLHADLARVASLKDKKELPALFAYLQLQGIQTPIGTGVAPDAQDPEHYTVNVSQSGLGLPDRDYYLKADDAKLSSVREKYLQHVATLLAMSGDKAASEHAAQVLDIETRLATAQWTRVQMRDPSNPTTACSSTSSAHWHRRSTGKPTCAMGLASKASSAVVRQPAT
jgi:predicted metalloendopeptidase